MKVKGKLYREDIIVLGGCALVIIILFLAALTVPVPVLIY